MITILKQPDIISLSGNSVPLKLQTDNFLEVAGAKAVFNITVNFQPSLGHTITIEWGSPATILVFEFVAAADDSGTEITLGSYPNIDTFISQCLLPGLRANPVLFAAFDITKVSSFVVRLTAREFGTAYSVTFAASVPANFTGATATAGADRIYRPNFKLLVEVLVRPLSGGSFTGVALELEPNEGVAEFDLGPTLHGDWYVQAVPPLTLGLAISVLSGVASYFLRLAEQYGSNPVTYRVTETGTFYSLFGAVDIDDYRSQSIFSRSATPGKFMTAAAGTRRLRPSASDFIWFLARPDLSISAVKVGVLFHYTDGSSSMLKELFSVGSIAAGSMVLVPVSMSIVNSLIDAGKTVHSFEISIRESAVLANALTETITFELDKAPARSLVELVYLNLFGVFERITLTGSREIEWMPESESATKVRTLDRQRVRSVQNMAMSQEESRVSTGLMSAQEMARVRDLVLSPQVYENRFGTLVPVRVVPEGAIVEMSDVDLYEQTLKLLPDVSSIKPRLA